MGWRPATPIFPHLFIPLPGGQSPHPAGESSAAATTTAVLEPPVAPAVLTPFVPDPETDDQLICYCFGVDRGTIRRKALEQQLHEVAEVTEVTNAGAGCGSCHPDIEDILTELWKEVEAKGYVVLCHELGVTPGGVGEDHTGEGAADAFAALTSLQKLAKITEVLNNQIRPFLQADGGDLNLIDVDGNRVTVQLIGACGDCGASTMTLRGLVEERLRQYVSPSLEIISI